jgi:hypothetical protein
MLEPVPIRPVTGAMPRPAPRPDPEAVPDMQNPPRTLALSLSFILLLIAAAALAEPAATEQRGGNDQGNGETRVLQPAEHHFLLDTLIISFLQNYHMRDHEFDAGLANRVFDDYINALDPGRY